MAGRALTGLAILAALVGCGDTGDYPALVPTDKLLAEPAIPGHAEIAASSPDQVTADLQAAGAALAVSSAEITATDLGGDDLGGDDLDTRAEALRRRASDLSKADLGCAPAADGTLPRGC
ncbi:MAG: hypothetical protein ACK5LJ_09560 [Paracoccus sp. (in: a-proteobacteria)]